MTDKSIVQLTSRELMTTDQTRNIEAITTKLMRLAQGYRRLNATEAAELAVASLITGADPFNQEIYHAGGSLGILMGIEWYKRRANEMLYKELGRVGKVEAEYTPATHQEAQFDENAGDIAWTCRITDTATKEKWLEQNLQIIDKLSEGEKGMTRKEAWEVAKEMVGETPTWEASAVVYASEDFEGRYSKEDEVKGRGKEGDPKPQKWDRNERCKKRALKWALKKRFSNMQIDTGDDVVVIDAMAREVAGKVAQQIAQESTVRRDPETIIQELGYDKPTQPPENFQGKNESPQETARPYSAQAIKAAYEQWAAYYHNNPARLVITDRTYQMIAAAILSTLESETAQHAMMHWLTGHASTKDLANNEIAALKKWIAIERFDEMPADVVLTEIRNCYQAALKAQGQMELKL